MAFGLAFVIFYNTGLINFMERTRDYATLKVLGYHQKEIRGLMIKESNLIALCGVLLGIARYFANAIMKLCETEMIVFSRQYFVIYDAQRQHHELCFFLVHSAFADAQGTVNQYD